MLPLEALKEYRKLVKKHFNITLTDSQATTEANKLINLIKVIESGTNMKNEYEKLYNGSKRTI